MITLPTIPPNETYKYKSVFTYSQITSPQNTHRGLIVGVPEGFVVCGTMIQVLTAFAGTNLTSLTCSLGAFVPDSILADINYYGSAIELTQVVTSDSFTVSGPPLNNLNLVASQTFPPATGLYFNGPHDVAAYFASQGATLNALTSGALEVTVHIRPL